MVGAQAVPSCWRLAILVIFAESAELLRGIAGLDFEVDGVLGLTLRQSCQGQLGAIISPGSVDVVAAQTAGPRLAGTWLAVLHDPADLGILVFRVEIDFILLASEGFLGHIESSWI